MKPNRPVWAWVISRFALVRLDALARRGTPSEPVDHCRGGQVTPECTWSLRLLRARTEGNLVLVMDASTTTKSLSLLLSDDHTQIGDALAHVFKTSGYIVERVSDGAATCARISGAVDQFDALIADHSLPRLSGIGLVESLRRIGFLGRILIYSAALSPVEVEQYRTLQAEPIVAERSEADRLLAIVKTLHEER